MAEMFDIKNPGTGDPIKDDFRNFLYLVWMHVGLPEPTPVQYDFAYNLQHADNPRMVFEAYRGAGKSWITSAFVCWLLLNNPDLSILVVSASKIRADDFTTFTLRLIYEIDILQHLIPRKEQRQSKVAFDVGPARAKHAPSVKSVGIFGQLAGSRANVIIGDDVEIPANSLTQTMRDKLWEAVKEFEAIIIPEGDSRIYFLGTPQTEMSLYNELQNRGYTARIWPARIPEEEKIIKYGGSLAPFIMKMIAAGAKPLQPVDPLRFDHEELTKREASYGRSGFALQFMLDTSLSDAERYPLRLVDLIVADIPVEAGPSQILWGSGPDQLLSDLPVVGFSGDKLVQPMFTSKEFTGYQGKVMIIDPSGRGSDETGYAVTYSLHGKIFLADAGGLPGGYDEPTLLALARIAKKHDVNYIWIEDNFGDGMFTELFKPVLARVHQCSVDGGRNTGQKEVRIIDTLEPVMNQHKLVVSRELVERDFRDTPDPKYQLFYQLTRITRDRGALAHDDRLDALAMAVAYWIREVAVDEEEAADRHKQELMEAEIEKFMEHVVGGYTSSGPNWTDGVLS